MMVPEAINTYKNGKILLKTQKVSRATPRPPLLHLYAKACDCVDHNKLENSERDGNTRPPDLPLAKPICRSGSNRHGTTDWFQTGNGVRHPACLISMQRTS